MEGLGETRLLEDSQSVANNQHERIGEETSSSARTLPDRTLGDHDCLFLIIGSCAILGTLWLAWRHDSFEEIWSLWQEEKVEYGFRPLSTKLHENVVNISVVAGALESGAVCLDGSYPAYFLERGSGEGSNNWLVFHEGGSWCQNDDECLERSYTELGSSRQMPLRVSFEGMLSSSPVINPDFYNWNRVLLKYCDGGSFNGDVSDPVEVGLHTNPLINGKAPIIFYRGQRIWKALMQELMDMGMKDAEKAFLSGCSAGGLATILHCDQYRDLMPKSTLVKCLSDAGFFIDIPDIGGVQTTESFYANVVQLQNMVANLPNYCISEREATRCFFPEYVISGLKTPFFILNSAYDIVQILNNLVPLAAEPSGNWDDCRSSLSFCSDTELRVRHGFRDSFLEKLQPLLESERYGAFIDSCYTHCQSHDDGIWNGPRSPKVDGKSIAEVVGDWYYERNSTKVVDCPFPCNPTCPRF